MKNFSGAQVRQNDRRASAGPDGVLVAPPAHGIDSLDSGSTLQRKTEPSAGAGESEMRAPNRTGLPDRLKAGVEALSGLSLDDVQVHYNSSKPAQLQALAFTQGTDIHVAPGQVRHLPHEAWHVVQQKQGRVKPTMKVKGAGVNNDTGLEAEASRQGMKALQLQTRPGAFNETDSQAMQGRNSVVQRFGTPREDAAFIATTRISQQRPANVSSMRFLYGKVSIHRANGSYSRPLALASVGEAMLEYINENPDEPDSGSTPVFRYEPDTVSIPGHSRVAMKDVVLGEIDAVMEFLEGKARVGGGGGLFQSNPGMRWAMLSPALPTGLWTPVHTRFQSLPGWASPVTRPVHGGSSEPQIKTPGGTEMDWYASYSWDSPGGSGHRLHAYGGDVEEHQTPLTPSLQSTLGAPKLSAFTGTTKTAKSQVIDQKLLNKWAGQRKGFRPDQNTAMSNTSANDAAEASFGSKAQGHSWQWLHLIAFTLGGHKGNTSNPNTQDNLAAGLAAANGHHLVIENLVKRLILGGKYEKIRITAVANMVQNSFHVAESIDYSLRGVIPGGTTFSVIAEFHIDTLDPSQSAGGDLALLSQLF